MQYDFNKSNITSYISGATAGYPSGILGDCRVYFVQLYVFACLDHVMHSTISV